MKTEKLQFWAAIVTIIGCLYILLSPIRAQAAVEFIDDQDRHGAFNVLCHNETAESTASECVSSMRAKCKEYNGTGLGAFKVLEASPKEATKPWVTVHLICAQPPEQPGT